MTRMEYYEDRNDSSDVDGEDYSSYYEIEMECFGGGDDQIDADNFTAAVPRSLQDEDKLAQQCPQWSQEGCPKADSKPIPIAGVTRKKRLDLSAAALERRRILEAEQALVRLREQEQLNEFYSSRREAAVGRSRRLSELASATVKSVWKTVNVGRWIDDLEKDQEQADWLERRNSELLAEQERRRIVREATAACEKAIRNHLSSFLHEATSLSSSAKDFPTFEDWIGELHPESVGNEGQLDPRYYLVDSDHRIMWNEAVSQAIQSNNPNDIAFPTNDSHKNLLQEANKSIQEPAQPLTGTTSNTDDDTTATQCTSMFTSFLQSRIVEPHSMHFEHQSQRHQQQQQ